MLRKLFSLSHLQVDQPIKILDRQKLNDINLFYFILPDTNDNDNDDTMIILIAVAVALLGVAVILLILTLCGIYVL